MNFYVLLVLYYFFIAYNIQINTAECGGSFSKCTIDYFGDAMANRTFIADNYGEEYEEMFKSYSRNYYRPELFNSDVLIESISNLDDPKKTALELN